MNTRDCPHGRQLGKCADCDVERLEAENEALQQANDQAALAAAATLPDDKMIVSRADYAELVEALKQTTSAHESGLLMSARGLDKARAALAKVEAGNA